jgi:hypothetical protein
VQFRENESERKVEPACTGFAHDPHLDFYKLSTQSIMGATEMRRSNMLFSFKFIISARPIEFGSTGSLKRQS